MVGRKRPLLLLALVLLCGAAWSLKFDNIGPGDRATHHRPIEASHSLQTPFDASVHYWRFGGSTVATGKQMRLTPATQSRSGWLWNDYPLESKDWEVEFEFAAGSKGHIGGDGFGFWLLDGEHDPTYKAGIDHIEGPLFGVRSDFKGFGVVFDTYDNDGKRDNPSVFVLDNVNGDQRSFNHDNDFSDDMVKSVPETGKKKFKCTSDYRNSHGSIKVLVRFRNDVLHVYLDNSDDTGRARNRKNGYRFCLAVNIKHEMEFPHIAFTALTGQLADKHDIHRVVTRYIDQSDVYIDDSNVDNVNPHKVKHRRLSWAFWCVIVLIGLGLCSMSGFEVWSFVQFNKDALNSSSLCRRLNQIVFVHYTAHFLIFVLFLFSGNWLPLVFNVPLLAFRLFSIASSSYLLDASLLADANALDGGNKHSNALVPHDVRRYLELAFYIAMQCWYLRNLIHAQD